MPKSKFDMLKINIINFSKQITFTGNLSKRLPFYTIEYSNRFLREQDRNRYIVTQYYLREFLSYYLQIDFDKVIISYSKSGKPYLDNKINSNLKFNYSHSGDYIIYAFAEGNEVGVDIEEIKDIPDLDELSRTHFSDEEQSSYFQLKNLDERRQLFYKIWTRKEALLKAEGSGITIDLKSLTVLGTNEKITNQAKVKYLNKIWTISDLPLDINYASSVAVDSQFNKDIFVYDKDFSLIKKI